MLKRLLSTLFFVGAVLGVTNAANAQYMKMTTDNPTDNTKLRATGTTIVTITLDTNHDKNASTQTCNAHTAANGCGAATTAQPLDMFSYTLAFKAVGGTVSWGTYSTLNAAYTDISPQIQSSTEIEINKARATGTDIGLQQLGTLPVTILSGSPHIDLQVGPSTLNPFGFGTGFGTSCDALFAANTYLVGDPTDPCGAVVGIPGDWFDWDGAGAPASPNNPPSITAQPTAFESENFAIGPIVATATDPDASNTLTITQSGKPADLTFTTDSPGPSPRTGTITGVPGFNDAGSYPIQWSVSDGAGGTAGAVTTLNIANTNRPPTMNIPAGMTVSEGATADQVLTGSDPDGDALTFQKFGGPTFMTVTTTNATTGNVHLAPGFSDGGTYSAAVSAVDPSNASFTSGLAITVLETNRAPTLDPVSNMIVAENATADQTISGSDPDGDGLSFSLVSAPTFATVLGTSPVTANIHLQTGFSDAGTYDVTARASDGSLSDDKPFTIFVNNVNRPPDLVPPGPMIVNEGQTLDQPLNASDPDGDPLTFHLGAGPTFASVTTLSPILGNLHLAPGFDDAGTYSAGVSARDPFNAESVSGVFITVNNVNRPPVLTQPVDMTVSQGATADQTLSATDPDNEPLTFQLVGTLLFATVTTTTPTTGNLHLAPSAAEPTGTYSATVATTDGAAFDQKQLTVTVVRTDHAPVLAPPVDMTVSENATADQALSATDEDGDPLTFHPVAGPSYMTVTTTSPGTGTATGNVHLAPGFSDAGTATAAIDVSDGLMSSSTLGFGITVLNSNRFPVLQPMTDMTVVAGETADQPLHATDPDGDPLTFHQAAGPSYATVTTVDPGTGTASGNLHMAPGLADAGGPHAVFVSVTDAFGGVSQQSMLVTVTPAPNHPPVIDPIPGQTVQEGSTADVPVHATDADNDVITLSLSSPPFVTLVSAPSPGTVTGSIHIAPQSGDANNWGVTVFANDGINPPAFLTFPLKVTAPNQNPTLAQPADMTVDEGTTADQALGASDPDADALTFHLQSGPTFASVTTTTPTTGNFHVAPSFFDGNASYAIALRVDDGNGGTDTKSLNVTVNNVDRPPVLDPISDITVAEGGTADTPFHAMDPDGDPITILTPGLPPFVTIFPAVVPPGENAGLFHVTPPFGSAGIYPTAVIAVSGPFTDTKTFTITVTHVNQPPALDQPPNFTVAEGGNLSYQLTASDPDADPLTFSKPSGPLFVTIPAAGLMSIAPGFSDTGTYPVTARVSDGSLHDDRSFQVVVTNTNRPPVANAGGPYTGVAGVPVTFDGTASSDPDGDPLDYHWQFGDLTFQSGAILQHTYTAGGSYTVLLTVVDPSSSTASATTTATISNQLEAFTFPQQAGAIKLKSNKPRYCFEIQPVNGDFALTDVVQGTIVMKYNGASASAETERTTVNADLNLDGIPELRACWSRASLRTLFSGLPAGDNSVEVAIEGNLTGGGKFHASLIIIVRGPVNGSAFALDAAVAPNPLNPQTKLYFETSKPGVVKVEMFDLSGRLVRTIQGASWMEAGAHEMTVDGRGQSGEKLASGVYFIRGETAEGTFKSAITILK